MDKNAIKKYAVWARRELIARVSQKALQYGITEKEIVDAAADSVNGKLLSADEKKQRQALIAQINEKSYEQVMEEVAYTWFNRFSALRFMEMNNYLPSHVRVFTDEDNNFKPQIITEAIHLELDGLDMEKVYAYKDADQTEELYKYLLIVQCNALNKILPGMFQKISDYTELLLPDNLLREGSVIEQMIALIPEDDWKDAVQIIGWLYQFYNIEPKTKVFNRPGGTKIKKEEIPAATQLFTPDWIVRYMVENSLGRLWIEGHKNDVLKSEWKYYLDEAEQEAYVKLKLDEIRKEYAGMTPEQIKCIDPCSGSGHILAYMFDVLMQIYEAYGFTTREAVASIVENNIYGLDIDDRAAQLAYFSVMMKARQYDRRFFSRGIQPHVYAITESNNIDKYALEYFCNGNEKLTQVMNTIVKELHDAKEYGSILSITQQDWSALYGRFSEIVDDINMSREIALKELVPLVQCAEILACKYDVVVTNPPYMIMNSADEKLSAYVQRNYPESKADLYSVFIEQCNNLAKNDRYYSLITMHSWMFTSSFEALRKKLSNSTLVNMAHLGPRAFEEIGGEVVQTTSFVFRKAKECDYLGTYARLLNGNSQSSKEQMFLEKKNEFISSNTLYSKIIGSPIAYWVSEKMCNAFSQSHLVDYAQCCTGMQTGNNDKYVRNWHEINVLDSAIVNQDGKYKKYNCGGESRKWYGNHKNVVLWGDDGAEIRAEKSSVIRNESYYYREGISWKRIGTSTFNLRYLPAGFIFDQAGDSMFLRNKEDLYYILAFVNSKVAVAAFEFIAPTMNLTAGNMNKLPIIHAPENKIDDLVKENIDISKNDWDAFETSWDFEEHPIVRWSKSLWDATAIGASMSYYYGGHPDVSCPLELCYMLWQGECNERFNALKENEEELNRIFIDIYGLQDELTPEVENKDVTVRKADIQRDIKSFISYAVGCMFGRYSLEETGLAYAGGEWNSDKYGAFQADKDNVLPICDDEYFEDDIVGRFVKFVQVVFGEEALDDNLKYIADVLGGKGQPKEVIRNYFLNDFYADHCKIYQKRPIYWLFDSGKKNGFKALIYMHRYQSDTIARIRTDYVHEQQARYRTAIADLENRIASASTSERVKLNKKLTTLKAQEVEIRTYEEKIHHLADQMISIDLDDGVKVNYEKFKDVLAKIK